MNAVVQFNPAQVPAFARRGELSETALALVGSGGGGKRISIKSGVFRLLDNGKEIAAIEERYLDVVLLKASKVGRVFHIKAYDPNATEAEPPSCWSSDGVTPNSDVESPQAKNCASCPKNVAGSGTGNSRACRYQQRVAVVLAHDVEGDVMQLALPATSLFGQSQGDKRPLQEYARWLAAQKINPETVVTRMRFDTDAEHPKLTFKAMRWLEEDEYATVEQKAASDEATRAVTMTVAKRDTAAAPAEPLPGTPPKAKQAAAAAPVVLDDDVPAPAPKKAKAAAPAPAPAAASDDDEPPTVRKSAPKAPEIAPDAKASLAKALNDWDDE